MQFFMKIHPRFLFSNLHLPLLLSALCAILLLNACASSNRISQDFKADTDFNRVKTFAWHNVSSEIPNINNLAIQRAVEQGLAQHGLQLVTTNPDVILDISIIAQKSSAPSTGLGISLGLPVGGNGAIGLGTSKLLARDSQQQGLIVLDITSASSSQVIWRGTAEAVPISYFLLRNELQLDAILQRLAGQFPPK